MTRYRNLLLLLLGSTFLLTPWTAPAQSDGAAPSAIRQVLEDQAAAWNRGDVDAFMRGYENSPQTAFVGKTVEYGYARILARYKSVYGNPAAMGKLTFQDLSVRMLGSNYAVVTGNFHLERAKEGGGDAQGIFSLVFARSSKEWKIILDHTSEN